MHMGAGRRWSAPRSTAGSLYSLVRYFSEQCPHYFVLTSLQCYTPDRYVPAGVTHKVTHKGGGRARISNSISQSRAAQPLPHTAHAPLITHFTRDFTRAREAIQGHNGEAFEKGENWPCQSPAYNSRYRGHFFNVLNLSEAHCQGEPMVVPFTHF